MSNVEKGLLQGRQFHRILRGDGCLYVYPPPAKTLKYRGFGASRGLRRARTLDARRETLDARGRETQDMRRLVLAQGVGHAVPEVDL